MTIKPTYSICIPVYNRILGFDVALESAMAVKGCTEIIVVDDNSAHNDFEEIISRYNDGRIKFFKNSENLGLFGNWNKAISYAQSEFVSILCSDDIIDPNIHQYFLDAYHLHPEIDVFFGSFATFTNTINDAIIQRVYKKGPITGVELLENALNTGLGFPVLAVMRREVMLKLPFIAKPHSGNDWLWIYSNATKLNLYASDQALNYWRRHDNQDAIKNQDITRDCWPLMYMNMSKQLEASKPKLAQKAWLLGKGLILTTLLNEVGTDRTLLKRLIKKENDDIFIVAMNKLISEDWLLKMMIANNGNNKWAYQLARIFRKIKLYPSDF